MKINSNEVKQIVWKACDTFRGLINPDQYKDYILTMLFIKYVSDVHKEKKKEYLKKYNGDEARAERAMKQERFIVPENSSFDFLYEHRNEVNLGELINIALTDFEEANRQKLSSEDGSGVFRNMFLHGFDNATIRWGDTIRNPKLKEGDALMKFDTVVANPPFSLDKWGKVEDKEENKAAKSYDPEHDPFNRFWRGIPPKSKGDWAFITHMIETTYEGTGKVGVVVPHGVLFRGSSEGKIRQKTIEENILEAVIGLPANLFFGTGIPAAILIFNKGKGKNKNVLFIDASQQYESVKNQNKLRDADIEHIVATYRDFSAGKLQPGIAEDKFSYVATLAEIQENEFNLNIPRYVDTFEEEAEVDINKVQGEIDTLEKELAEVQMQMKKYLEELGV